MRTGWWKVSKQEKAPGAAGTAQSATGAPLMSRHTAQQLTTRVPHIRHGIIVTAAAAVVVVMRPELASSGLG